MTQQWRGREKNRRLAWGCGAGTAMPAAAPPPAQHWIEAFCVLHFLFRVKRSNAGSAKPVHWVAEKIWFAPQRWTRFRNFTIFHNQKNMEEIMNSASVWISSLAVAAAGGWFAA